MILHGNCEARAALVEDISKVDKRRSEGYCIDGEHCKDVEFDWKHLVCTNNLNGDLHSELFIFILRRCLIILLHKVFLTISENSAIRSKLKPNVKGALALNVTESGIEFQILFEASREEEL